jgi:hypothetical protein
MIDGKQTWVPGDAVQQLHLGQAPGGVAQEPPVQPAPAQSLAVPTISVHERAWAITYVTTTTSLVNAPSIDEALRRLREKHGAEVEVVQIQRT